MTQHTHIFTIRHGHTAYNAEKRYAGTIDISLSEKGVADCLQAARALAEYRFDVLITSTQKRSIETGALLMGDNIPTVRTNLCNERNYGIMEGHTWDEILKFDPPILMINVGNDLHTVNPSGSEPFEDVWQRAKSFKRFLFRHYAGKRILVVSHGTFMQMFHGLLRGLSCIESLADFPSNLVLYHFEFKGVRMVAESSLKLTTQEKSVNF